MAQSALKQAIEEICAEKNIPYQSVIETVEAALAVAYRKDFGQPNENVVATFDATLLREDGRDLASRRESAFHFSATDTESADAPSPRC